jgi:hypothetical protein
VRRNDTARFVRPPPAASHGITLRVIWILHEVGVFRVAVSIVVIRPEIVGVIYFLLHWQRG